MIDQAKRAGTSKRAAPDPTDLATLLAAGSSGSSLATRATEPPGPTARARRCRRSVAGREGWSWPPSTGSAAHGARGTARSSEINALLALPRFGRGGLIALALLGLLVVALAGGVWFSHPAPGTTSNSVGGFLAAGAQDEAANDWADCVSDYSNAIADDSTASAAFAGRGRCEYAGGEAQPAANDLSRAIELGGTEALPSLLFARARAYDALGDNPSALADFHSIIGNRLSTPADVATAVEGIRNLNDLPNAIAAGISAVHRYPSAWQVHDQVAITRGALNQPLSASSEFTTALQLAASGRDRAQVLDDRAQLRQAEGDLSGALADSMATIALNPQWDYYRVRAGIRQTLGDLAGADDDLTNAIAAAQRTYPNGVFVRLALHDQRGKLRLLMGLKSEAAADFYAALALAADPATRALLSSELSGAR